VLFKKVVSGKDERLVLAQKVLFTGDEPFVFS
jgi:hypothetical protein